MSQSRVCRICSTPFEVADRDEKFYRKMDVPGPTLCPTDMHRARLSFRNEVDLYKRKCAKTGKEIITYYPPHAPQPVYDKDVWWSDDWDPLAYGQEIDFGKPFFEQFMALERKVPKANIYMLDSENCDYTNYATHNKNCYLVFGSWFNQDCLYGQSVYHSTGCIDCHFTGNCQWCYECIDCNECYETAFSQNAQSCTNCWFLYDCRSCENCIGCWNLRRKKFHVWNKPVSEDEFRSILQKLKTSATFAQTFLEKFREHVRKDVIHRALIGENNENVSGNYIYNSRNIVESYNVQKAEDIYYSDRTLEQKDQYFCTGVHYGELAYNSLSVDFSHTVTCGMNGEHHTNTAYCLDCYNVEDCFGCVGLRKKKHCILNKQYSEQEYKALAAKLREHMKKSGEWGEFFPVSTNSFFYNRSIAHNYFPLTKEEAEKRGYRWKEDEERATKPSTYVIPDSVSDVKEDICDQLLVCTQTGVNYRITSQELEAYKKMGWPVPRIAWQERYSNRLAQRPPRRLWQRQCGKCKTPIRTSYDPARPETVYCEKCYLETVY